MDNFSMENAIAALDTFRCELARSVTSEEAATVRGLEIYDVDGAKAALQVIRLMKVPESLENLRWMTVSTLQNVAAQRQQVA